MFSQPFMPQTATVTLTVGTASSGVALPAGALFCETVRIVNSGANTIYVELSSGPAAATAAVASSFPMLPNTIETFTFTRPTFVSAVAAATGNTLSITAGTGA